MASCVASGWRAGHSRQMRDLRAVSSKPETLNRIQQRSSTRHAMCRRARRQTVRTGLAPTVLRDGAGALSGLRRVLVGAGRGGRLRAALVCRCRAAEGDHISPPLATCEAALGRSLTHPLSSLGNGLYFPRPWSGGWRSQTLLECDGLRERCFCPLERATWPATTMRMMAG